MRTLTNILLLLSFLALTQLHAYSQSSIHTRPEKHVLQTLSYSLWAGLATNTLCGLAAPRLDPEIPSSDAFMSCAPFGVIGSAITARVYVFATGGYGPEEWVYWRQLPKEVERGFRGWLGSEAAAVRAMDGGSNRVVEMRDL